MTNQNVVAPETMALAIASAANPTPTFHFPSDCSSGFTVRRKYLPKLELGSKDGGVTAWIESMKASSPTRAKAAVAAKISGTGPFWTAALPSALDMFGEITGASAGKQIVMFLDYDGTLSPIVDDPDRAFMTVEMRDTVRDVAKYFPTAIVSGRCRYKVYNFVRLAELCYAGSHGMDIKIPAKGHILMKANAKAVLCQPASKYLPMIDKVYRALLETTKSTPGAKVENNKFCLSVHFRCVNKKRWSSLADQVRSVVEAYPKLKVSIGRKVLEIRPSIKWDKGKALEFLLESFGFAKCKDVFPVYIGDDRTDEDAFKVLRSRGQGSAILVSKMPKETDASYSLQEPSEVMDFLQRLVEWQRRSLEACPKV